MIKFQSKINFLGIDNQKIMDIITITGAENSTKIKLNIEMITFIDL